MSSVPPQAGILSYSLAILWRIWPRLATSVAVVGLTTGAFVYFGPRSYTVSVMFLPEAGPVSNVSSLAAQFGLDASAATANESPYYYVELLKTQELQRRVVAHPYRRRSSASDSSLADLLWVDPNPPAVREAAVIRELGERTIVSSERRTGIVTLSVRMPSPLLSRDVADMYVRELQEFNLTRRRSRASAERQFLDARVEDTRRTLRQAEDELRSFLQQNRSVSESPRLQFEGERLRREVLLRASVLQTVEQSAERARMDEVRNTPQLSVLQPARIPAEPDRRNTIMKALTTSSLAFIVWFAMMTLGFLLQAQATKDSRFKGLLEQYVMRIPRIRGFVERWFGFRVQ